MKACCLFVALVCVLCGSCGRKNPNVTHGAVAQNDSLMALFEAPVVKQQAPSAPQAKKNIAPARVRMPAKVKPAKPDTAASLEAAIQNNASVISVDSGSSEDKRLDSLMKIANTLSDRYRALVATHTHQNLAQAAHQDPSKTRRLLTTISEKSTQRIENAKLISEERKKRLQELTGQ